MGRGQKWDLGRDEQLQGLHDEAKPLAEALGGGGFKCFCKNTTNFSVPRFGHLLRVFLCLAGLLSGAEFRDPQRIPLKQS